MRECCTSGSARGARRKARPYRNKKFATLNSDGRFDQQRHTDAGGGIVAYARTEAWLRCRQGSGAAGSDLYARDNAVINENDVIERCRTLRGVVLDTVQVRRRVVEPIRIRTHALPYTTTAVVFAVPAQGGLIQWMTRSM